MTLCRQPKMTGRRRRLRSPWAVTVIVRDLRQGPRHLRPTRKPGQSEKPIRVTAPLDDRLYRQVLAAELRLSGKTFDQIADALGTTKGSAKRLVNKGTDYLAIAGTDNPVHDAAVAYCAVRDRELERVATALRAKATIKSRWTLGPPLPTGVSLRARRGTDRRREVDRMQDRYAELELKAVAASSRAGDVGDGRRTG